MANKALIHFHSRTATKPKEKFFSMPFGPEVVIFDEARGIYTKLAIFQDGHATTITTTIKSGFVKPTDMTPFHKGYDTFLGQQEKKTLSAQAHKKRIFKAIARRVTTPPSRGSSTMGTSSPKSVVPAAKKDVCRAIKPRRRRMDLAEWLRSGKAALVEEKNKKKKTMA
ncbi:hypothetical protein N7510_003382 [Penicillium lagena]|uniref:uncharacterized protein n=1 Tax=Penicillium lagena TaxID=94218 RepID=UPI002541A348|nr:uncharacterized protein N7510_003382 [Penicillium lagena]KAJ5619398.1 hypothetical protein N7510_003382 [Penicillium lagena]